MARRTMKSRSVIQKTTGVVGSRARVRNTRMAVWTLVEEDRRLGASDDEPLYNYSSITRADLEEPWQYYE